MYSPNLRDENGDSIIPASQRPDGTWRKARRVKEGYVPQEEVPLYESKGKQFASRSTKPGAVSLPSGHVAHQSIPGLFILDDKEKTKNKKKAKNIEEISKHLDQVKLTENVKTQSKCIKSETKAEAKIAKSDVTVQKPAATESNNQITDPAKRLKNLKKRLREVELLEEKLKSGQIPKPEPEQMAKIQRKNDLLMQIRELEKLV